MRGPFLIEVDLPISLGLFLNAVCDGSGNPNLVASRKERSAKRRSLGSPMGNLPVHNPPPPRT